MKTEVIVSIWPKDADTEKDAPVLTVYAENGNTEIQSYTVLGEEGQERELTDMEVEEVAAIAYDALKMCANDVASMPLTRPGGQNAISSEDCGTSSVPEASEPDAD